MLKTIAISLAFAAAAAAPLSAQGKGQKANDIPPGMRPPAGMCRIWLDGVPPGQQPAPTDCATAVRNRPSNGRVIFGDDYADGKGRKLNGRDKRQTAPREDVPNRDDRRSTDRIDRRSPRRDDDSVNDHKRKSRPRDSTRSERTPE
ncbi:MAG: hypothetical protein ACJ79K_11010 [Gemmatimonadaceae bacterium]